MGTADGGLDAFNALGRQQTQDLLLTFLAVPRWAEQVAGGRPYPDRQALRDLAARAARQLTEPELDAALARHPRIGQLADGEPDDSEHSRREQAGVDPADAETAQQLADGNLLYEKQFGRVFLIRAAGRSAAQILAELNRRLGNDQVAERAETVSQLGQIAVLRLEHWLEQNSRHGS